MKTKIVEATNGEQNWGKFLIGQFDESEYGRMSVVDTGRPLLPAIGWGAPTRNVLVLDLQTGEGAMFLPGGYAAADLDKHKVWVCPLFEPFLTWLYTQDLTDVQTLPDHIDLPDAPFGVYGYRRKGEKAPQ